MASKGHPSNQSLINAIQWWKHNQVFEGTFIIL